MTDDRPIIRFQCPGIPQPQGSKKLVRDKRTGKTRMIDDNSPELKAWREAVGWAAKLAEPALSLAPYKKPVSLEVAFELPGPGKRGEPHSGKPDLDKLLRAICDALTKIVWDDDKRVAEVRMHKRVGPSHGVWVTVWPWGAYGRDRDV